MKPEVTALRINYLTYLTFLAIILWSGQSYAQEVIQIDADFPGGNIIVDGVDRSSPDRLLGRGKAEGSPGPSLPRSQCERT